MYLDRNGTKKANRLSLLLLIALILIQATAFSIMKHIALGTESILEITNNILFYFIIALVFLRAVFWPIVLHHIEFSFANSLNSIVPILILLSSYFIFNEIIELKHIIGGTFIIIGNILICKGKSS